VAALTNGGKGKSEFVGVKGPGRGLGLEGVFCRQARVEGKGSIVKTGESYNSNRKIFFGIGC
jgi:hypothetical protein